MSGNDVFFDKLAWRFLTGGATDEETLAGIAKHLSALPGAMSEMPPDASARVTALRRRLPPPRTDEESWAMLDAALGAGTARPRPPEGERGRVVAYPTFEQIEAERRALALAGKPHGYDSLGGRSSDRPFPGQRSTIVRRYAGHPAPGTPIPGICESAPPHQHAET